VLNQRVKLQEGAVWAAWQFNLDDRTSKQIWRLDVLD
jgi:hypothetical protein